MYFLEVFAPKKLKFFLVLVGQFLCAPLRDVLIFDVTQQDVDADCRFTTTVKRRIGEVKEFWGCGSRIEESEYMLAN